MFKRFLNRDGTFNIERAGVRRNFFRDVYHGLITAPWPRFFLGVLLAYLSINLIFGFLFFAAGPDALKGVTASDGVAYFWECFFFSVQTLATIGYGQVSPASWPAHVLVTVEALLGMTSIAMTTGVMFARFSRPTARVVFSRQSIIGDVDGDRLFYFRVANARLNQILEARVRATLIRTYTTRSGERYRDLTDLKLVRDSSPIFALTWTVEHAIDESSPLFRQTAESLRETETEILITLTGLDEGLSQTVHTRFSYTADDMVWDRTYTDIVERLPDGKLRVLIDKIHAIKA